MAATARQQSSKGFEESLWDTANKLRGTVESSEYKHVILSLIFLKFASDKLRDTRLPKLLSGELRIPDAEKLMEDALV